MQINCKLLFFFDFSFAEKSMHSFQFMDIVIYYFWYFTKKKVKTKENVALLTFNFPVFFFLQSLNESI